ncbi:hypothetical protein CASFOL_026657 [Castilleja foliolosa]|uniref:TPX2 C-terminal domain-containing protein n=1 Tax=Castilleja foliolosa TaxID=1961234 RepID=A0ABD3CHQ4_9LAMI
MDSSSKIAGAITPAKEKTARSKLTESHKHSENVNPNVSTPGLKLSRSPLIAKSEKIAKKSAIKNPNLNPVALSLASPSPKKKIRERKFVIAKKKSRNVGLDTAEVDCEKCKKATGKSKCLCLAYESLRASQEDFFKNRRENEDEVSDRMKDIDLLAENKGAKPETERGFKEGTEVLSEIKENVDEAMVSGDAGVKRSRDRLLEETRGTIEVSGSSKVKNLVKEFEKLSMRKLGDAEEKEADEVKDDKSGAKWELCGLEQATGASLVSSSSFCPSDFCLTSESLGLDSGRSYSLDSARGSIATTASVGGRKLRRTSSESSGNCTRRHWKRKQLKATSQKPFMLSTELNQHSLKQLICSNVYIYLFVQELRRRERGKCKEEEFVKKLRQMMEEEEKKRIPIAQGLPWTTEEPECLVKPPVKEITRPIDLVLNSDVRAVERSEFDHQVAVKMSLIEQYRMDRERQHKLEEEEEIRRLRKELVPKAQPLPYFDRPFVPKSCEATDYT